MAPHQGSTKDLFIWNMTLPNFQLGDCNDHYAGLHHSFKQLQITGFLMRQSINFKSIYFCDQFGFS